MNTNPLQNRPTSRTTRFDVDQRGSSRFSRILSNGAIFSVVALIVVFQVADRVLGRSKSSGGLKVI